ncbi:MAG TPA: metallophosphoesterase [Longimicrobiales bacterium]|nr:metallophosphoesterase [Longimicrobiales bacterium]
MSGLGAPDERPTVRVRVGETSLLLDASGAAVDPATGRVFVADLHLGKGATLRTAGLPIPPGTSRGTMDHVARLADLPGVDVREVWVLGDLIHTASGLDAPLVAEVAAWIEGLPGGRLHLVRGNHDLGAGRLPPEWALEQHDEPHRLGGLDLAHIPPHPEDAPPTTGILAGHLHPMVRPGRGRTRAPRTSAFVGWGGPSDHPAVLVLPAQGRMVDGAVVGGRPGLHAWACGDGGVVALPPGCW